VWASVDEHGDLESACAFYSKSPYRKRSDKMGKGKSDEVEAPSARS